MTAITETSHTGSCLLSQASGHRSFDNVTLVSGQDLAANTVLGKITSGGKYTAYDNAASDGSEAAAGILYAATDATDGDVVTAVIIRDAEVNGEELVWPDDSPTDITAGIADLKALGIIVRT